MRAGVSYFFVISCALLNGCAIPSKALWRAGASRVGFEDVPRGSPVEPSAVEVHFKPEFGWGDEVESRRLMACSTTTILRKAFLLPGAEERATPDGDWEGLAHLTTEEFPRDEERSDLTEPPEFGTVFGIGTVPMDLFEVRLDPAFLEPALDRLRTLAAQLGADAVIDVFATGELEHHMWEGFGLGFDTRSTSSWIYTGGTLLDARLRDVRLHGIAVRRAR
jgi:hypothetical protein